MNEYTLFCEYYKAGIGTMIHSEYLRILAYMTVLAIAFEGNRISAFKIINSICVIKSGFPIEGFVKYSGIHVWQTNLALQQPT